MSARLFSSTTNGLGDRFPGHRHGKSKCMVKLDPVTYRIGEVLLWLDSPDLRNRELYALEVQSARQALSYLPNFSNDNLCDYQPGRVTGDRHYNQSYRQEPYAHIQYAFMQGHRLLNKSDFQDYSLQDDFLRQFADPGIICPRRHREFQQFLLPNELVFFKDTGSRLYKPVSTLMKLSTGLVDEFADNRNVNELTADNFVRFIQQEIEERYPLILREACPGLGAVEVESLLEEVYRRGYTRGWAPASYNPPAPPKSPADPSRQLLIDTIKELFALPPDVIKRKARSVRGDFRDLDNAAAAGDIKRALQPEIRAHKACCETDRLRDGWSDRLDDYYSDPRVIAFDRQPDEEKKKERLKKFSGDVVKWFESLFKKAIRGEIIDVEVVVDQHLADTAELFEDLHLVTGQAGHVGAS